MPIYPSNVNALRCCFDIFGARDGFMEMCGNVRIIEYVRKSGIWDQGLLEMSAMSGSLPSVRYIYEKYSGNIRFIEAALGWAVREKNMDVVKYLIHHSRYPYNEQIIACARWGYIDTVQYLVEIGVRDGIEEAIKEATSRGQMDVVEYLTRYVHEQTSP